VAPLTRFGLRREIGQGGPALTLSFVANLIPVAIMAAIK